MTFIKLPKAITAEELLSTPLPPVKWIVPGLLPAGLALFAGPSKAGKSWLTLWLCLETAQTACNTEYLSVIADVDYRIHPRWNLYVKGAYETGKVYKANGPFAKGMYRRSWNAQSSLEFFPIKNSDLFIFLLYTYRGVKLEKAALDMGAVDPDTHRISLGLVYSIPVF